MAIMVKARFDGHAFLPDEPVDFAPDTQVNLTVEPMAVEQKGAGSFFEKVKRIRVEGPRDWSANLDRYLYGDSPDER